MRPIDADILKKDLLNEYNKIVGYRARIVFYSAIDIVEGQPTITPLPNDPLTISKFPEDEIE